MKVVRYKCGYEVRTETSPVDDETLIENAYNPNGHYIGDAKIAHYLVKKRKIMPQYINDGSSVCQIGYCTKDGKWYGWSHRAIHGFSVGSTCKMGDLHYNPKTKEDFRKMCKEFYYSDFEDGHVTAKFHTRDGEKGVLVTIKDADVWVDTIFCPYPEKFGRGEWVAETTADAKQMAIDYAEGVS